MLRSFWKSKDIGTRTKLRIYKSNVLSVLLYGSEFWKVTGTICRDLEVFQNKCLRRILRYFWPDTISNEELLQRTGLEPVSIVIKRRRWKWLGHVHRMAPADIPKIALRWTPEGRRTRGRPKETWRRSVEKEMRSHGLNWESTRHQAQDRSNWRSLVNA